MRTPSAGAVLAVAVCLTAGAAGAELDGVQLTISPYAGAVLPDDAAEPRLDAAPLVGFRAGFRLRPWFGIEATYGAGRPQRTASATETDDRLNHVGADLVLPLLPRARFLPYLAGGWAQLEYDLARQETQTLNGWEAGGGVIARLGERLGVRLDARDVLVERDAPHTWLHNLVLTAGLHVALGGAVRDDDGDGVGNRDDRCPGTPAGATVDARGCPTDADADGVWDGLDACAATPAGATVDARGCPTDADADGVWDGLDRCPETAAGLQVDADGCPIAVPARETELLDTGMIRLQNVEFDTNRADVEPEFASVLDEVGNLLAKWPQLEIEIGGHTDSYGTAEYNQALSLRRAQAVLDYLEVKFPQLEAGKYRAKGYGESAPLGDERTRAGRAQNRRVEFRVLNREVLEREMPRK